jgi:uncharacterized protein (TIGR03000 family)
MVGKIFARSNMVALALLGTLLVAEPAAAQRFRRAGGADYNADWYGTSGYYSMPSYYTGASPMYQSFFTPQIAQQYGYYAMSGVMNGVVGNSAALINVSVPADAVISFEGRETTQTGDFRQFISPALTSGQEFTYDIEVRWNRDGTEVTRNRHITVHAGDIINLVFRSSAFNSSQSTGNSIP